MKIVAFSTEQGNWSDLEPEPKFEKITGTSEVPTDLKCFFKNYNEV
jgi:hypothetical protein